MRRHLERTTDPPEVSQDQDQQAREAAWKALNRRDRTVAELRGLLLGKGAEPAAAERVVAELRELGYLDDARYAQRFAEDRRRLDAWGSERIEQRLKTLGVAHEHVEAAIGCEETEAEVVRAVDLLRRRYPQSPSGDRERSRALGMLVRRGYGADAAYEALRRHASA